jgi:hypothetical protein
MLSVYIPTAVVGVEVTLWTCIRDVTCSILSGNVILAEVL